MLRVSEDLPDVVAGILDALEREDFTHEQRRELAKTMSTRHFEFQFYYNETGEIEATVISE